MYFFSKTFCFFMMLAFLSCSSDDSSETSANGMTSEEQTNTLRSDLFIGVQINNSKVFGLDEEVIKVEDGSQATGVKSNEFATINTLKEGFISTTFTPDLGAFGKEKDFELIINFNRRTSNPKLLEGSYKLAEAGEFLINPEGNNFEVVTPLASNVEEFLEAGAVSLDELEGKFIYVVSEENKVIIDKVTDLDISNTTSGFQETTQLVEGSIQIALKEFNSNEDFLLRIKFKVINKIKLKLAT